MESIFLVFQSFNNGNGFIIYGVLQVGRVLQVERVLQDGRVLENGRQIPDLSWHRTKSNATEPDPTRLDAN